MIVGLAEVRELSRENSAGVALVVSHSGGKDSMRMLGVLQRELPELPIYCVLADTGFEHQTPVSAEDWVQIRCASLAHPVPVTVVRNPNKTYLKMVERRGRFPSAQYRQCTSDLKRGPIERIIRSLGYKVVIHCMGIRAEDSRSRAQLQPWSAKQCADNPHTPGLQLAPDLRGLPARCSGVALEFGNSPAPGVHPRVSLRRNQRRIPTPVLMPGLHLLDRS
jgi:3'-phosphoadenosine 5'-phosphosulfate sulfotransferase (PAPS reductase)/FAD synthetase